jgi:hypothetical protein
VVKVAAYGSDGRGFECFILCSVEGRCIRILRLVV